MSLHRLFFCELRWFPKKGSVGISLFILHDFEPGTPFSRLGAKQG